MRVEVVVFEAGGHQVVAEELVIPLRSKLHVTWRQRASRTREGKTLV